MQSPGILAVGIGEQVMVKGELEKIRDMKLTGLPDPIDMGLFARTLPHLFMSAF
ncbi:MAG: hypothetical protein K8L99_12245 [Anaerolineae bacterium]|nr:hypothetical protein [Anaerolineae bacterium]